MTRTNITIVKPIPDPAAQPPDSPLAEPGANRDGHFVRSARASDIMARRGRTVITVKGDDRIVWPRSDVIEPSRRCPGPDVSHYRLLSHPNGALHAQAPRSGLMDGVSTAIQHGIQDHDCSEAVPQIKIH